MAESTRWQRFVGNGMRLDSKDAERRNMLPSCILLHLIAFLAVFILTSAHKSFAFSLLLFSFFACSPCHA